MNRQYLEYSPEVGAPTANSHHGQQHRLQKQPECKAANLSNNHDAENLFSSGGPCRRFRPHLGLNATSMCPKCHSSPVFRRFEMMRSQATTAEKRSPCM